MRWNMNEKKMNWKRIVTDLIIIAAAAFCVIMSIKYDL